MFEARGVRALSRIVAYAYECRNREGTGMLSIVPYRVSHDSMKPAGKIFAMFTADA